jgi:hypothetical protein
MDYVHTLSREGRPLAVVANPMAYGSYASCFHCDSAMLERNPWQGGRSECDRLRWKLGRKTLVWWEGYEVQDFVDPQAVTPEQLASVYEGLADFTVLQSLRVGFIPPPNFTQGVARLARWLPSIVECVQTGWEPVPAVRVPEPAWASRYGRGLQTRLALAHETGQAVALEAVVENGRLGRGAFLFLHHDGRTLGQSVRDGATIVPLDLPVRRPVLLRAALEVRPRTAVTAAEVRLNQGMRRAELSATLSGKGKVTLAVAIPPGMVPGTILYAGEPLAVQQEGTAGQVEVELGEHRQLTAEFTSDLFQLEEAELLDFPFVLGGRPSCTLVATAGQGGAAALAAFRLQDYFRYWYARACRPPAEVVLPIARDRAGDSPAVVVRVVPGAVPSVRRQGAELLIEAGDAAQLHAAMDRLLRALDGKYWTCDWFGQETVRDRLAGVPGP